MRIGFGYDVHQLKVGNPLWLGGILIDAPKGGVGHSDADVLIHALCDALLGAVGLRDIGYHYPDTDPKWKDQNSTFFLQDVMGKITKTGWQIENMDCTVCLESPKISPYINLIKNHLSLILKIKADMVSVKATTSERLGFVGQTNGITAYAVVLLSKIPEYNKD